MILISLKVYGLVKEGMFLQMISHCRKIISLAKSLEGNF